MLSIIESDQFKEDPKNEQNPEEPDNSADRSDDDDKLFGMRKKIVL